MDGFVVDEEVILRRTLEEILRKRRCINKLLLHGWMDEKDLEKALESKKAEKGRSIIRIIGMREAFSVP